MELKRTPLNTGWHFKQTTSLGDGVASSFLPVSQFPTVAHIDLLHHGLIKDPYIECNELDTLWFVLFNQLPIYPTLPLASPELPLYTMHSNT
jgi:beta-mannosidase